MALQMEYTDASGTTHPESYWRVAQVNLCAADQAAGVTLYGYHDLAARTAGLTPVGQRTYRLDGDQYAEAFSAAALNPLDCNPAKAGYEAALADPFFAAAAPV